MDVVDGANTFESIPKTQLLDTSASRDKAQLASAIPSRRPPTKQRSKVSYIFIFGCQKMEIFLFQNSPKNVDPSNKMDLDFGMVL